MTVVVDPSILPLAQSLLECLVEALAETAAPPRRASLRTGNQVELLLSTISDECCEGSAWVRVASFNPSAHFPDPDAVYERCAPIQWAVVLEMGVARCAPTPAANTIPSEDDWNTVAAAVLDDAAAMRRAVCCFADLDPARMYLAGQWVPLTVEGGCTGGTMPLTVAFGQCDC